MTKYYFFKPRADGLALECRFPNFLTHDIFFYVSGVILADGATVAISALQIAARSVGLRKGCFDLYSEKECECKFFHNHLKKNGIQSVLLEDIVKPQCSFRHVVEADTKIDTHFTFDFKTKVGGHEGALLRVEQFGDLIYKILQEDASILGASSVQKDIFLHLKEEIGPGDTFIFLLPGGALIRSQVSSLSGSDGAIKKLNKGVKISLN